MLNKPLNKKNSFCRDIWETKFVNAHAELTILNLFGLGEVELEVGVTRVFTDPVEKVVYICNYTDHFDTRPKEEIELWVKGFPLVLAITPKHVYWVKEIGYHHDHFDDAIQGLKIHAAPKFFLENNKSVAEKLAILRRILNNDKDYADILETFV